MAFDVKYFVPLSAMANSNVPRYFLYKDDTDSLATIATANYFLSAHMHLQAGDIIRVFPAAGVNPIDLVVLTATSTSVTVGVGAGGTADLTATNTLVAGQSGGTFFLNSATEFVTTLPAPAPGLKFKFICKAAPASASYTIVTASSANIIVGQFASSADAGGSMDSEASGGDTITFVDGQAVKGDWVEVISDGTNWYATGMSADEDALTITTAS